MAVPERLVALRAQNQVTGIDFVYVHVNQTTLDVYFLRSPSTLAAPLVGTLALNAIHIYSPSGGESLPVVPVQSIAWTVVNGRDVLRIQTAMPGDFSRYRLRLDDARVDRFFNDTAFSFKANCPSDLDCTETHECAPDPSVDFPIDHTARDFWSFRRALLDFASERHPRWQDRLEADVGSMMAEVMSALGDEFAYNQDRIGREAHWETATERRSLRRHASLVDYHVHDGLGAHTWLDFQVVAAGNIQAGTEVTDPTGRVRFEVGRGLDESFAIAPALPKQYAAAPARNLLLPHQWDEDDLCLAAGSTELFIEGAHSADLPLDDTPVGKPPGRWVVLVTKPTSTAVKPRALVVRLIAVQDTFDPVLPPLPHPITRLEWEADQATPFEMDMTILEVHGNVFPATAGKTTVKRFTIGTSTDEQDRPSAIERVGPDGTVAHLFSLPESDLRDLVYLGEWPENAAPEIRLTEVALVGGLWIVQTNGLWDWRRELLGVNSALSSTKAYRLDDGFWRRVVGYRRIGTEIVHNDYATGEGKTVRFGDNEFGLIPADNTIFQVTFRLGRSSVDNVVPGTLTQCALPNMTVSNPLPSSGGIDPESAQRVKQRAPEAFRAVTFRAVRPEDYAEAVERLPWVQRAGATFLWTGSWLTAFATPDPKGAFAVTADQRSEATAQLDRFRQAGRPAYLLDPRFATLDLVIVVCVATFAYKGEVKKRVLEALFGIRGLRPRAGFFDPDRFTFGTPLERSELEATIQAVEGVKAVEEIQIRRRGYFDWRLFTELTFGVSSNEVIRLQNDVELPERGSVNLDMRGGA